MLDFRVKTFLNVCKTLNFTKTAELMHITQPAVSQHIRYIEDYYRVKLFYFKGKKMYLSEEGKLLRNALTTIDLDAQHLRETLCSYGEKGQKLNFGVTLTVGEYILPEAIGHLLKDSGDCGLKMKVANTAKLLEDLNDGEIDFAVVEGYFPQSDYDYRIFSAEDYIAVCSGESTFSSGAHALRDLFSSVLITREKGSGTREIMERSLEDHNYTIGDFSEIIEINDLNAIKKLVSMDCGITFLYRAAVQEELIRGKLCKIGLSDFSASHNITFIWRKNSIYTEVYRRIFYQLKKYCF